MKRGALFLSNSVEVLFEHLKAHLFSEEIGVFSERILITPSQSMQQWIQMRMASTLSISCGLTTTFLDKALKIVREKIGTGDSGRFLPSRLDLLLRIEYEMDQALSSSEPLWEPLKNYAHNERRKMALAKHLAQLFERYGIYGNRALLDWEKRPTNWQEALWVKIFKDWEYPQRLLGNLSIKEKLPTDLSLHFFAFSHISPLYFHFFNKVAAHIPVYFYQLSPCQEFWSDIPADHPSLLGTLGKVGREMAKTIEESDLATDESYLVFGGNTQLKRLQRSLLTLQTMEEITEDDSIEIHLATTPHQEIENLHEILRGLCAEKGIQPKDILVMAPNIAVYAPYIRAVFGDIAYQIADMPLHKSSGPFEAFFLLLDLEKKRWSAPAVLELFNHPLFCKKQAFSQEDMLQLKAWVHATGIRWAFDGAHRSELLKKGHCQKPSQEETSTWMEGLGHLIEELALPPYDPTRPPRIAFTQAELLGKIVTLLRALRGDLSQLEAKKTAPEWVIFLRRVIETYFLLSEETQGLFSVLEKIEKGDKNMEAFTLGRLYPFSFIYTLLKECVSEDSITLNRNQIQAVRFCSLLPMRAIPAKIICLIGMNHDTFPRKEQLQGLDLLRGNPKSSYSPSRIDFDRYLFLEALLSAREKLIISYLGQDAYDLTELPPSTVIAELFPFIKVTPKAAQSRYKAVAPIQPAFIRVQEPFALPQGAFAIDTSDLLRFARSGLRHYLYFHDLKMIQEKSLQEEEAFIFSPLSKALFRKNVLKTSSDRAFKMREREGDIPLGLFGKLAEMQVIEEIASLPKNDLTTMTLKPFSLPINSSLTVTLTGTIEGVFSEGLCVSDKEGFKGAAKAWPLFLLLNREDASKQKLLFAPSQGLKSCFFEDPIPFLVSYLELFFYAKAHPIPLIPDWIEPILKRDAKKMAQIEIHDPIQQWYLRGKKSSMYEEVIEAYHPLIEKVYQGMQDAWF